MRNRKKLLTRVLVLLLSMPVLLVAFFVFIVGPVDTSKENSVQYAGVVESITEGPSYDIVFTMKDHPHTYYINRGLERGLDLASLQAELTGEQIELWYAKSWPMNGGHMTHLKHEGQVVFNEWKLANSGQ